MLRNVCYNLEALKQSFEIIFLLLFLCLSEFLLNAMPSAKNLLIRKFVLAYILCIKCKLFYFSHNAPTPEIAVNQIFTRYFVS